MANCDHCGSFVTARYKRVFGVNGVLRSCQHCSPKQTNRRDEYTKPRTNLRAYDGIPEGSIDG